MLLGFQFVGKRLGWEICVRFSIGTRIIHIEKLLTFDAPPQFYMYNTKLRRRLINMSLDLQMVYKIMRYKERGYEVTITDEGMWICRDGKCEPVLALSAEHLIIIEECV